MKRKLGVFAAMVGVIAAMAAFTSAPAATAAPPAASISNTISGTTATGLNLTGTLSNMQFVNQAGNLVLQGVLNGQVTNAAGDVVATITNQAVTLPVIGGAADGSCTILDLTLGPLHLDLLGLVVDLNQVHLTITGQTGNGNLLGNLLCGLANALNGGGGGGTRESPEQTARPVELRKGVRLTADPFYAFGLDRKTATGTSHRSPGPSARTRPSTA
jgi:hypothetical protein